MKEDLTYKKLNEMIQHYLKTAQTDPTELCVTEEGWKVLVDSWPVDEPLYDHETVGQECEIPNVDKKFLIKGVYKDCLRIIIEIPE